MRHLEQNPPWANRALKSNWDLVEGSARERGLPMPTKSTAAWKFEELGCGHYGCVMPTSDDGIVFKLTSDPTEGEFIRLAMPLGWPEGIVRYYAIVPLDFHFRKRPVFAIWREAAYEVGTLSRPQLSQSDTPLPDYLLRERKEFVIRLDQFKDHAARFRDALKKSKDPRKLLTDSKKYEQWAWDNIGENEAYGKEQYGRYKRSYFFIDNYSGAQRLAASWRACQYISEVMESTAGMYLVGGAFSFYMDNGFLLADVHQGNVGKVNREDYSEGIWVITDPGHVVVLW